MDRLMEAARVAVSTYIHIIGDLTQTVRIGDFLFIEDDGFPLITEAKKQKRLKAGLV